MFPPLKTIFLAFLCGSTMLKDVNARTMNGDLSNNAAFNYEADSPGKKSPLKMDSNAKESNITLDKDNPNVLPKPDENDPAHVGDEDEQSEKLEADGSKPETVANAVEDSSQVKEISTDVPSPNFKKDDKENEPDKIVETSNTGVPGGSPEEQNESNKVQASEEDDTKESVEERNKTDSKVASPDVAKDPVSPVEESLKDEAVGKDGELNVSKLPNSSDDQKESLESDNSVEGKEDKSEEATKIEDGKDSPNFVNKTSESIVGDSEDDETAKKEEIKELADSSDEESPEAEKTDGDKIEVSKEADEKKNQTESRVDSPNVQKETPESPGGKTEEDEKEVEKEDNVNETKESGKEEGGDNEDKENQINKVANSTDEDSIETEKSEENKKDENEEIVETEMKDDSKKDSKIDEEARVDLPGEKSEEENAGEAVVKDITVKPSDSQGEESESLAGESEKHHNDVDGLEETEEDEAGVTEEDKEESIRIENLDGGLDETDHNILIDEQDEEEDNMREYVDDVGEDDFADEIGKEELEKEIREYEIKEEKSQSHFFSFLLVTMFLSAALYLVYHNKRKVIGLIIPSNQRRTGSRQRGYKANYERLDKQDSKSYVF